MKVEIRSEYDGYRLYYPETDEVFQWVDEVRINERRVWLSDEMEVTAETIETLTDENDGYPKHIANLTV